MAVCCVLGWSGVGVDAWVTRFCRGFMRKQQGYISDDSQVVVSLLLLSSLVLTSTWACVCRRQRVTRNGFARCIPSPRSAHAAPTR